MFVVGNPLRYTDPTGHWYEDPRTGALVPGDPPPLELENKIICEYVASPDETRPSQFVLIESVRGPDLESGGGVVWYVRFRLPEPAEADGYIVQKITRRTDLFLGEKLVYESDVVYYEAFKVKKGRVTVVLADTRFDGLKPYNDAYTPPNWQPFNDGTTNVIGIARFYEGDLPEHFAKNNVSTAPALNASYSQPTYWDGCGTNHSLQVSHGDGQAHASYQWGGYSGGTSAYLVE